MSVAPPAYARIKRYVLEQIHQGVWAAGDMIPGEEALARQFGVSRMTVNRAIRELSDEQLVTRVKGSGTFVATQKYHSTLLEIHNIADEIAARGNSHRSELQRLERVKANDLLARSFHVAPGEELFHSVMLHFENDLPIQVEDRYVSPRVAPDYIKQSFAEQTPNAYLWTVAPLQRVDFYIEARTPSPEFGEMLHMPPGDPCLVLHRQAQAMNIIGSVLWLWYPAARYRFTGHI